MVKNSELNTSESFSEKIYKVFPKNALKLVLIAVISVTILSLIKEFTKEDYKRTQSIQENKSRKQIFKTADSFKKIKIGNEEAYLALKAGQTIGILVKGQARGFGGNISILLGYDLAGSNKNNIHGFVVLKHNETPGLGTKAKEPNFKNAFKGKNLKTLPEGSGDFKKKLGIDTIAGATITSVGVLKAIKNALKIVEIYKSQNTSSSTQSQPSSGGVR